MRISGLNQPNENAKPVRYIRPGSASKEPQIAKEYGTGADLIQYSLGLRLELGLRDISKLSDDWDTYGAKAPTKETIELAKQVCLNFPEETQPEIEPCVDGSIALHWPNKYSICLMVRTGDNPVRWYMEDPEGNRFATPHHDLEQVATGIRKILSSNE